MTKKIWFDMDGTIADLYGVENWLNLIRSEEVTPYLQAKPLLNFIQLSKLLNKLQANGYEIGIISWTAKGGTVDYNKQVVRAKKKWLQQHLTNVVFDEIAIIDFGTPKHKNHEGILFDDNARVRQAWNSGVAYDEKDIIATLKSLL